MIYEIFFKRTSGNTYFFLMNNIPIGFFSSSNTYHVARYLMCDQKTKLIIKIFKSW